MLPGICTFSRYLADDPILYLVTLSVAFQRAFLCSRKFPLTYIDLIACGCLSMLSNSQCPTLARLSELNVDGDDSPIRLLIRLLYINHLESLERNRPAEDKYENAYLSLLPLYLLICLSHLVDLISELGSGASNLAVVFKMPSIWSHMQKMLRLPPCLRCTMW